MKKAILTIATTLLLVTGLQAQCPTATLPWLETFANGLTCWYKPAGSNWHDVIPYNDSTLESMRYLYLQMQNDQQGSWIMSQAIQIPADSSLQPRLFWKVASNTNDYALHYGVLVTTSSDYTNTSNYTQIYYDYDTHWQWSNYEQLSVSLAQYAGQTIHIAFHNSPNMCPPDDRCVCIDDVEIRAISMPTVSLMAEDIAYQGQSFTATAILSEGSTTNLSFIWHSSLLDSTWTTTADSTSFVYPIAGIDSLTVTANNIYGSCTAVAVINVISGCNAVLIPYVVDFEGLTPTNFSAVGNLPGCWTYSWNGTIAAYAPHVITTGGYPFSGLGNIPDNALLMQAGMYSSTCAEVVLPGFIAPLQTLKMALDSRFESATQGVLEVGYYDNSDFIPIQTIAHQTANYRRDTVSFANVTASNAHIAIRFTCNFWYGAIIDNIEVFPNFPHEADSLPWIAITPSPNPAMALRDTVDLTTILIAGDTTGLVWTWNHTLPCTAVSSGARQRVVYTAVGTDSVTVIAANTYGSDTATTVVNVYGDPHITLNNISSAVANDTVILTATLIDCYSGELNYSWNSTMATAGQAWLHADSLQLSLVYSAAGTDTITLVVCNALACDTVTRVLTVYDCSPRTVPFVEDFSEFDGDFNLNDVVDISILPQYLEDDQLPGCWDYSWGGDPSHRPFVIDPSLHPDLTFINRIGSKALLMQAGINTGYASVAYVMLPVFASPLQNLTLVVGHLEENFNYGTLTVGYMQNEVFIVVEDITNNSYTLESDTVRFDMVSMANADARMALRWVSNSSYWSTAIERIEVFGDTTIAVPDTVWHIVTLACDSTMGSVSGGGSYVDSSLVTISATALEGYHFVEWNDADTHAVRQILVTSDTAFTAFFAIDTLPILDTVWRTVTVTANVEGACHPYGSGVYADNSLVTIGYTVTDTVTDGGHWQFLGWDDSEMDNPRQIVVASDTVIVALFQWVADSVGIGNIAVDGISIRSTGDCIVVKGASDEVSVFDMMGRIVATAKGDEVTIPLPAAGVYLVRINNRVAKKVVVIK